MKSLYLGLAAALIALPAYAQTSPGQPGAAKSQQQQAVDQTTREFVEKAAIGDMFEIQSSKLALDKSQSQQVQDFADRIIEDHTKSSEKLKSIVGNLQGVQVPQQLDSKHREMMNQLQNASGQQFHQLYRKQQIQAHEDAVQLFESYSKNGQNKQLQQFAGNTLPTLKEHLQMAQKLPEQAEGQAVGQAPSQQKQAQQQQAQQQTRQPSQQAQDRQAQTKQQKGAQRTAMQPLAQPGPDHIMGSDLRGTTVYGANNENIGEIDDLVLNRDGELVAVIVGVGGFLGIGEKNVAIPFEALEIAAADQGQTGATGQRTQQQQQQQQGQAQSQRGSKGTVEPQRIVLRGMTREDLEKAPAFDSN